MKFFHEPIESSYNYALSTLFTGKVIEALANNGKSPYLSEILVNTGIFSHLQKELNLYDLYENLYSYLLKNYRNEYVYKNEITKKILLGRHSISTASLLPEFRVGKNKADLVLVNGSSTAFEIKSEYDSFKRLPQQLDTYLKVFEYVNVVTCPSFKNKIMSQIPNEVGVLVLSKRNSLSLIREPVSNLHNIDLSILFDSLRKPEYLQIIKSYYDAVPDAPNTLIHNVCKELFCKIPLENAISLVNSALKERSDLSILKELFDQLPTSLYAYAIGIQNQRSSRVKFDEFIDKEIIVNFMDN